MKRIFIIVIGIIISGKAIGQSEVFNLKSKIFKTTRGIEINGETGILKVPENRNNPNSRSLEISYVRLKSLSKKPLAPVVYLEGGGGGSSYQVEDPSLLSDWIELLEVSDLIFLDRRGYSDNKLTYVWAKDFPQDFFLSEEAAHRHYQNMIASSLKEFQRREVDVTGYTLKEQATDVHELMNHLKISRYCIFGFSFGSQIAMTLMNLFPNEIDKAILAGADAPDQAFNYPRYLDIQIKKIDSLLKGDERFDQSIPSFEQLTRSVFKKLEENPITVTVKHPITRKKITLKIGPFGLALILRLDIDDTNDLSVIPRLLYMVDHGKTKMLKWFVQKRLTFGLAVPGNGINQQLSSGVSEMRWNQIKKEAKESIFGNVVNFPFSAAKDHWISGEFSAQIPKKLITSIPTLFITGDLDSRTPIEQVKETMKSFSNAIHISVKNAGHEDAMWEKETFDFIIPAFLKNETLPQKKTGYRDVKFISVEEKSKKHPSLRKVR